MKKILFAVLFFMLFGDAAYAQWARLDLPPGYYRDIYFSADKTGFLVGDSGMVLKTVDDGATWRKIDVDVKSRLRSVHFPSANVGYIIGDSVFLKTVNGGESWAVRQDSIFANSHRILFTTENIGFLEEYFETKYRTEDGGKTWNSTWTGMDLCFINPAVGFGVESEVKSIVKTIDSGKTWKWVKLESQEGIYGYAARTACWFTDENNGVIGGWYDGFLALTSDGGKNWEALTGWRRWLKDSSGMIGSGIYDIFFPTKKTGYAIGDIIPRKSNSQRGILKTYDGGKNWTVLKIDSSSNWYAGLVSQVYFTDENTGYMINGQVLKTTTGGEEPVSVREPLLKTISTSIFPNPFKNTARIELPENSVCTNCSVKIYDIAGRDVTEKFSFKNSEREISISSTSVIAGEYVFTVIEGEKIILTGKFLKETE